MNTNSKHASPLTLLNEMLAYLFCKLFLDDDVQKYESSLLFWLEDDDAWLFVSLNILNQSNLFGAVSYTKMNKDEKPE